MSTSVGQIGRIVLSSSLLVFGLCAIALLQSGSRTQISDLTASHTYHAKLSKLKSGLVNSNFQKLDDAETPEDELEREREELQHQEDTYMAGRKVSVAKAMSVVTDPAASKEAKQEDMNVRWRAAHEAYEQAAYNDIKAAEVNTTTISDEGLKHFQDIEKESESVMGVSEYADLLNASYKADAERRKSWQAELTGDEKEKESSKLAKPSVLRQIRQKRATRSPWSAVLNALAYDAASKRQPVLGDTVVTKDNFLYRAGGMLALNAGDTATVISIDTADGVDELRTADGRQGLFPASDLSLASSPVHTQSAAASSAAAIATPALAAPLPAAAPAAAAVVRLPYAPPAASAPHAAVTAVLPPAAPAAAATRTVAAAATPTVAAAPAVAAAATRTAAAAPAVSAAARQVGIVDAAADMRPRDAAAEHAESENGAASVAEDGQDDGLGAEEAEERGDELREAEASVARRETAEDRAEALENAERHLWRKKQAAMREEEDRRARARQATADAADSAELDGEKDSLGGALEEEERTYREAKDLEEARSAAARVKRSMERDNDRIREAKEAEAREMRRAQFDREDRRKHAEEEKSLAEGQGAVEAALRDYEDGYAFARGGETAKSLSHHAAAQAPAARRRPTRAAAPAVAAAGDGEGDGEPAAAAAWVQARPAHPRRAALRRAPAPPAAADAPVAWPSLGAEEEEEHAAGEEGGGVKEARAEAVGLAKMRSDKAAAARRLQAQLDLYKQEMLRQAENKLAEAEAVREAEAMFLEHGAPLDDVGSRYSSVERRLERAELSRDLLNSRAGGSRKAALARLHRLAQKA